MCWCVFVVKQKTACVVRISDWSADVCSSDLASRAVARVQGLLGVGSVTVPEWRGSRDPATQVALVEAEAVDPTAERTGAGRDRGVGPGPGRLPTPAPARGDAAPVDRAEEHTSEIQSLMRISLAGIRLKK